MLKYSDNNTQKYNKIRGKSQREQHKAYEHKDKANPIIWKLNKKTNINMQNGR